MAWEKITDTKMNQTYVGHAEEVWWSFQVPLPEQLGARIVSDRLIQAHIDELAKSGSVLLELTVWEDAAPFGDTLYTVRSVASASPLVWGLIVAGVVAALLIIGVVWSLDSFSDIVEYVGKDAAENFIDSMKLMGYAAIGLVAILGVAVLRRKR